MPFEAAALSAAVLVGVGAAMRAPLLGALCAVLLVAGLAVGEARIAAIDSHADAVGDGTRVEAAVTLLEPPEASAFGASAEVSVLTGELRGATLLARTSGEVAWPEGLVPGAELAVTGYARRPEADPEADLDWPAHLRRQGVAGELEVESVRATGRSREGALGVVDAMRARAETALEAGLEAPEAALIRGMVLGQDQRIDDLVEDDFRASGLAHLLAVSGQNIMLLGLLALPVLVAIGLGPRGRVASLICLIAVYVPLAGAGPSLQRAGVMGAAGLVAVGLGRPASRWYVLLLAAATTLAINPRFVGEAGWQLSFAAVVGILVLAPGLRRALRELPRVAGDGIAITVAATVATAPLLAHHFDQMSLASLPANVLALPAVAPAMWIGMAQIALAQLVPIGGPVAAIAMALAATIGAVNGVLLAYLGELARRFAELPWAQIELSLDSPVAVGGAYAAITAVVLAVRRPARRAGPSATALVGWWRSLSRGRRAGSVLVLCVVLLAIGAEATAPDPPPEHLTVSFLDVGQGDATLLRHPDGGTVLIDGGPVEARVYRLVREAGVDSLDLVIATHAAADHHAGLHEVLERMPVDLLLEGGDGTDDPDFESLLATADRLGVRHLPAQAGQAFAVGGLSVEVVWPEPRPPGPPPEDPNDRAVTTVIGAGDFELLASGDAESPSLAQMELPDVDVLKVPHHASEDPGLPAVLDRVHPEIAAIGVGADNTYGHPHPTTLDALDDAGVSTYRTDTQGTVTLTVEEGRMHVATER